MNTLERSKGLRDTNANIRLHEIGPEAHVLTLKLALARRGIIDSVWMKCCFYLDFVKLLLNQPKVGSELFEVSWHRLGLNHLLVNFQVQSN